MVVQVAWRDVTLIISERVDDVASMNMIENWITKPKGASSSCSDAGRRGVSCCKLGASVTSAQSANQPSTIPTAKARACAILVEFERAQTELVGKAVILTNGKAGTVDRLWLDELHGLQISIGSHEGNWPVATIKFAEK